MADDDLNPADFAIPAPAPQDLPIAQRGLDMASLLQMAGTGAQGKATPNYAADAAAANSRVASILSRSLRDMERDPGYRRMGAALTADIASQGARPYAATMESMEGQDLARATNIANAITGLSKGSIADMRTIGNLLSRQNEASARAGNAKAQRMNEMVRAAAASFDDPALAQAQMYGFLARKQIENPKLDINDLPALMAEAIMDARRSGLTKGGAAKARGETRTEPSAAATSGMPTLPSGEIDFTKPIQNPKAPWERLYNMSSPEDRKTIYKNQVAKASGTDKPERPDKAIEALRGRELFAANAFDIMNRIEKNLDEYGANVVGVLGTAGSILGGAKAQISALIKGLPNTPLADKTKLEQGLNDFNMWKFPAFIENSANSAVVKSQFITLAYMLAGAREQGGKLSNADVQQAMNSLGANNGDPFAIKKVFADTRERTIGNLNRERQQLDIEGNFDPDNLRPLRKRSAASPPVASPAAAPAQSAPAQAAPAQTPQAAPAAPQEFTPQMRQRLEELRRNQKQ